ncbi:hypothetical protein TcG_04369 [Trypanosoma cruzi]|uniref:Uncharacterized protein n=2 Tax=Trypanosoma cruzi TaxID=5693 RepID=V5BDW4_TRYCR|nr:hypothetical protein TCDM_05537 [Trypanosoma cruzi Dm28c]PBJ68421.1 hypothetical protein BCY84_21602 [Trypanosoma cruzi cruzi]PWU91244.1 hypothetical protein C4B63_44g218 [Trypanosoma cruzi]RNF18914.1 hypothetical protein TcG_04369 [Trypanosoma cruzi]
MKEEDAAPLQPLQEPHSAWKRALDLKALNTGRQRLPGAPNGTTLVGWTTDTLLPGGEKDAAASGGRGGNVPRGTFGGTHATDVQQSALEFIQEMYGMKPLDAPVITKGIHASERQKRWGGPVLFQPSRLTNNQSPTKRESAVLRRVKSHHGTGAIRDPLLRRLSSRRTLSQDHLGTIVDHIFQGYMQTNSRAKKPLLAPVTKAETDDSVSQFVSNALDSFLVREASFSLRDAQSMNSFLTLGGDCNFSKLLSFQGQSQFLDDDDPSELLTKPAFEGRMALFAPLESQAEVSVSGPLPEGSLAFVAGVEVPCPSPVSLQSTLETETPPVATRGAKRITGQPCLNFSREMSLDSDEIQVKPLDILRNNKTGDVPTNIPKNEGYNETNPENCVLPTSSGACPLPCYSNAIKFGHLVAPRSKGIEQLISDEDLKRSVLVAVEQRFRKYLCALEMDEATEISNANKRGNNNVNTANPNKQPVVIAVAAPQPMVQNLLDFFGK